MSRYVFFVFLHVLVAILAFGTAMLAFPVIGALGEKDPVHVNFALRLNYVLGRRAVTPLALATFGLGLILVFMGDWNLFESGWLWISMLLFLIAVADTQLVTLPTVRRLVEFTTASSGNVAEPSSEVAKLYRKVKVGGSLSSVLLTIISLLMVWKPGA